MKSPAVFKRAVRDLPKICVSGVYYRCMSIQHIADPLSGIGSYYQGGRYNAKESFEILYMAPDEVAAATEGGRHFFNYTPKLLFPVKIDCHSILDLGNKTVINALGIEKEKLILPWKHKRVFGQENYTQKIGRCIYESKLCEGIKYPSAYPGCAGKYNLGIFPDSLRRGSRVVAYDPDKTIKQIVSGKK